jgi:hypothetical protein
VVPLATYRAGAPVVHAGRVYRVLESSAGQRVVQEWTSGYWMPSLLPLFELQDARMASPHDLAVHQVPVTESARSVPTAWITPSLTPLPHQDGVARKRKVHA